MIASSSTLSLFCPSLTDVLLANGGSTYSQPPDEVGNDDNDDDDDDDDNDDGTDADNDVE